MDNMDLFQRMGLAIAIGATVGVERHWREKDEEDGARTAGIRTFTLIGMLGGTAGMIEQHLAKSGVMPGLVLVGFLATLTAVFALFQFREEVAEQTYSVTSVVVAMMTFSLGALAVLGDLTIASAGAVVLVAILASREFLHEAVRKLQWAELRSAVILLALTFVVLPIVPSEPIGPFGGITLSSILVMVIVLAAISFCGYIAVRLFGDTVGEVVAGAIGGVVSSTAVTISNARRSAGEEKIVGPLAAGAASAGGVSLLRTGLLVFVLAPPVAPSLIGPLLVGAAVMLAYAWALARRNPVQHQQPAVKNPFDLDAVVKLALVLVGVAFLARAASAIWGDSGLYVASALAGLADVDAAVVTVAGMLSSLTHQTASAAIGLAVLSNMLAKAVYSSIFGSRAFAAHLWAASVIALAVAIACHLLVASL